MADSFKQSKQDDFKIEDNFKGMQLDMFKELKRFDAEHKSDFPPLTEGLDSFLTFDKVRCGICFFRSSQLGSGHYQLVLGGGAKI